MILVCLASLSYLLVAYLVYKNKKATPALIIAASIGLIAHAYSLFIDENKDISNFAVMQVLSLICFFMVPIGIALLVLIKDNISCLIVSLITAFTVWFPFWFNHTLIVDAGWQIKVHIAFSISAYIALGYAALYACLLLVQDYRLRKGVFFNKIPIALNEIERIMLRFTIFGELLLTFSLASGIVFIDNVFSQHILHKVIFSVIAWFILITILFLHYQIGFRGKRAALWLLSSFILLIIAYLGSAIILQLILHKVGY